MKKKTKLFISNIISSFLVLNNVPIFGFHTSSAMLDERLRASQHGREIIASKHKALIEFCIKNLFMQRLSKLIHVQMFELAFEEVFN